MTMDHKYVATDEGSLTTQSYVGVLFEWSHSVRSCLSHLMVCLIHGYEKSMSKWRKICEKTLSKVYVELML